MSKYKSFSFLHSTMVYNNSIIIVCVRPDIIKTLKFRPHDIIVYYIFTGISTCKTDGKGFIFQRSPSMKFILMRVKKIKIKK